MNKISDNEGRISQLEAEVESLRLTNMKMDSRNKILVRYSYSSPKYFYLDVIECSWHSSILVSQCCAWNHSGG